MSAASASWRSCPACVVWSPAPRSLRISTPRACSCSTRAASWPCRPWLRPPEDAAVARITLDRLAHSYRPDPEGPQDYALKEIHHVWDQGGAYALLGPSGCGKTTLLNIISGLVHPTRGRILFDERDVTDLPTEARNIRSEEHTSEL